jgi:hypothetical protein
MREEQEEGEKEELAGDRKEAEEFGRTRRMGSVMNDEVLKEKTLSKK